MSTTPKALITGITGQDGSYLAELLLQQGYEVTGIVRRLSASNSWRIDHLGDRITLRPADLLDQLSLVAEQPIAGTARKALDAVRRGIVAYSGV